MKKILHYYYNDAFPANESLEKYLLQPVDSKILLQRGEPAGNADVTAQSVYGIVRETVENYEKGTDSDRECLGMEVEICVKPVFKRKFLKKYDGVCSRHGWVNVTDCSTVISGHRFVDLGLHSGLLWAEENVGAQSNCLCNLGGKWFAWGELETKERFSKISYRFYEKDSAVQEVSKYNFTDKIAHLEAADDVASEQWGERCRIASPEEWQELIDNCSWNYAIRRDKFGEMIDGWKLVSRVNGRSIFLPIVGYKTSRGVMKDLGSYWTNQWNIDSSDVMGALSIKVRSPRESLYSCNVAFQFIEPKNTGCLIRPVARI